MRSSVTRRHWLAVAGLLLLALPLATYPSRATDPAVIIDNFTFGPESLEVKAGATVTWTNHDDIPHSIVATNGKFHSRALDTEDAYSFTFVEAGTYDYFCGLHPHMKGRIVVVP